MCSCGMIWRNGIRMNTLMKKNYDFEKINVNLTENAWNNLGQLNLRTYEVVKFSITGYRNEIQLTFAVVGIPVSDNIVSRRYWYMRIRRRCKLVHRRRFVSACFVLPMQHGFRMAIQPVFAGICYAYLLHAQRTSGHCIITAVLRDPVSITFLA